MGAQEGKSTKRKEYDVTFDKMSSYLILCMMISTWNGHKMSNEWCGWIIAALMRERRVEICMAIKCGTPLFYPGQKYFAEENLVCF
jgi:hypothetical protein